jgi:hypothetical protein
MNDRGQLAGLYEAPDGGIFAAIWS